MFDIGWSEFAVIAVVALIAIGPKELPGVLRMVGQWMGKARKMAAEFQGQFQEAMREAEMADLKKTFDEVKEAASGFGSSSVMSQVGEALRIDDKPAISQPETPRLSQPETPAIDAGVEASIPETFTATDADARASQPLDITPQTAPEPAPRELAPAPSDVLKDAKAS